jgi:hypothetical protein
MIPASQLDRQSTEDLRANIAAKRASFDWNVRQLERRLSPRERLVQMRTSLRARVPQYAALAAAAAVLTGLTMAFRGWRGLRFRSPEMYLSPDHPLIDHSGGRGSDDVLPF